MRTSNLRLAMIATTAATISAATIAFSLQRQHQLQLSTPCREAFAAQRWAPARAICASETLHTGAAAAGVRAAGALLKLDRYAEAIAAARPWFRSKEDAMARQVAGAAHVARGEPGQAVPLLRQALDGHLATSEHQEVSRDRAYLAGALYQQGLLGDALDAAEKAVQSADLIAAGDARDHQRGRAQLVLGKILGEVGDLNGAQKTLWDARGSFKESPRDQSWVFLQLGILLHEADVQADAKTLLEPALDLAMKTDEVRVIRAARLNLARVHRELGELDAAELQMSLLDNPTREKATSLFVEGLIAADRGHFERANHLLSQFAARDITDEYAIDVALQQGMIAERRSEDLAAERYYRRAISFVEKLRDNTDALELRSWILAQRHRPYHRLLALLARQKRTVEALAISEALHASTWRDAIERRDARRAPAGVAVPRPDRAPPADLLGRLLGLAPKTEAALGQELLEVLRGREALIFTEADSTIWRFHVQNGAVVQLDQLPGRSRPLLARWLDAPEDHAAAAELGALLIPPSARAAAAAEPLYLVTNGPLGALPFAALRFGERRLVEDRVIARLPGISALRCRSGRRQGGDRVFLGDSRGDLRFAREETAALAKQHGGSVFLGSEVTATRLEASKHAELLHLAVHVDVDRFGARILLADQAVLTTADIVKLQIGPRVAVLAGCATAVSRDAEGWGALSSAFLASGSRSVVATLISVKDEDAARIMPRFYSYDWARQPALALAQAQRELLSTDSAAKLSSWASFAVYGSALADDCEL